MSRTQAIEDEIRRFHAPFLAVGVVGLVACAIGFAFSPQQFFRSYLFAYLFWLSIGLGCLPVLMLYHLVGGAWGYSIRRILESGTRTILLLGILFIPVLAGMRQIYTWVDPVNPAVGEAVLKKSAYLNVPFFIARAVFFFILWWFFANRLNRWSAAQDETGDIGLLRRFGRLSGPGITLCGFTVTFALIDWAMSLEPRWFSTVYGMLWFMDLALSALAFSIVVFTFLGDRHPLSEVARPEHLHDLGNLLFASLMLWAYLSFCQLLIIWSGDVPEEISWYLSRLRHGWEWTALVLIGFQFFVPWFLLLSRRNKRQRRRLGYIALLVLGMRIVDTFWMITPAFYPDGFSLHWLDPVALAGIGGIWLAIYARQLLAMPLLALNDPNTVPHKAI
ncbi:MAG TPA: hypothetical protein VGK48_09955 [Terriglobia bacterium]|jgi:hypothetical protein